MGNFKIKKRSHDCFFYYIRVHMNELKLYEISEEYINFLRKEDCLVLSAKEDDRNHTRKYLGIVYTINNMIPVPKSELSLYDAENEPDKFYKALIQKELIFIRKNQQKIIQNAKVLYKQKKENSSSIGYLKSTVDFSLLEKKYDEFIAQNKNK